MVFYKLSLKFTQGGTTYLGRCVINISERFSPRTKQKARFYFNISNYVYILCQQNPTKPNIF